jgi:uncharacterized membrane protein YfcA
LKISQKGLYALQAMMTLARRYQQGAIKVRDIASEADVPGKFLELILLELKKGAMLTTRVSTSAIAIVFGLVLIGSAYLSRRPRPKTERETPPDPLATRLRLNGSFPDVDGIRSYNVQRVPLGWTLMFGAGTLSGLLGIGSGAMKVLAMDQAMKIPFKVSTTTSNFMIGVTAAASAGVYLARGYIDPGLSMPVVLGVLAGSLGHAGSRQSRSSDMFAPHCY